MSRVMLFILLLISFISLTNCIGGSTEEIITKAVYDAARRELGEAQQKLMASINRQQWTHTLF